MSRLCHTTQVSKAYVISSNKSGQWFAIISDITRLGYLVLDGPGDKLG